MTHRPVTLRFGAALGTSRRGDRDENRTMFADLRSQIAPGDAFHLMAVAHAMADVQA